MLVRCWMVAFVLAVCRLPSAADPIGPGVDRIVLRDMAAADTPGVSIAIVRDGKIVYAKGYGFRDRASGARVDTNTLFRFGSLTKQFVAGAALLLDQDGALDLESKVARWFPWATDASDITLADLLGQTSGYRDYYPLDFVDREMSEPQAVATIVRRYATLPLTANPRTRWEYSNTNYALAGSIVERVAGEPLETFMRRRIFGPAGMTRTGFDEPPRRDSDRATGYDSYFTEPQHVDSPEAPKWLNFAGGLAGTATDVARWDLALMRHSILGTRSVTRMFTARTLEPGNIDTAYGFGVFSYTYLGRPLVSHTGEVIGFGDANIISPKDETAIVVLTNSYETPVSRIGADILRHLLKIAKPPRKRSNMQAPALTRAQAASIATLRRWLVSVRAGDVEPHEITTDFRALFTPAEIARVRATMRALGTIRKIRYSGSDPRGGLTITSAAVTFARATRTAVLMQDRSGQIAEVMLFH